MWLIFRFLANDHTYCKNSMSDTFPKQKGLLVLSFALMEGLGLFDEKFTVKFFT